MLLLIHIAAGLIAIAVGYVALFAAKGAAIHRRAGRAFVYTMPAMALIGAWMSVKHGKSPEANLPIGLLTTYLVITGLTAVRPPKEFSRQLDTGFAILALSVGLALVGFGVQANNTPTGKLHGIPTVPFFIFGVVALLASAGDFRLIRSGGTHILRGAPRLTRHLWRMCVALLIAAFSLFTRVKVFPQPYRIVPQIVPPLIVLAALLYWLWRIKLKRSLRGLVSARAPEPA